MKHPNANLSGKFQDVLYPVYCGAGRLPTFFMLSTSEEGSRMFILLLTFLWTKRKMLQIYIMFFLLMAQIAKREPRASVRKTRTWQHRLENSAKFLFYLMWMFVSLYACAPRPCAWSAHRGQEKASNSLELESETVVRLVGWNKTRATPDSRGEEMLFLSWWQEPKSHIKVSRIAKARRREVICGNCFHLGRNPTSQ